MGRGFARCRRAIVAARATRCNAGVVEPGTRKTESTFMASLAGSLCHNMICGLPDRSRSIVTCGASRCRKRMVEESGLPAPAENRMTSLTGIIRFWMSLRLPRSDGTIVASHAGSRRTL
jgi:hypothetical protein